MTFDTFSTDEQAPRKKGFQMPSKVVMAAAVALLGVIIISFFSGFVVNHIGYTMIYAGVIALGFFIESDDGLGALGQACAWLAGFFSVVFGFMVNSRMPDLLNGYYAIALGCVGGAAAVYLVLRAQDIV